MVLGRGSPQGSVLTNSVLGQLSRFEPWLRMTWDGGSCLSHRCASGVGNNLHAVPRPKSRDTPSGDVTSCESMLGDGAHIGTCDLVHPHVT